MGQRLNIEIKKDKETLANCYYHWSGYTHTALNLTECILSNLNNTKEFTQEYAVALLKATGADFGKNRNAGLIGITTKDIEETRNWEEARVEIDLQNKQVKLDVYWNISEEDIKKYPEEYENYSYTPISFNPFIISFKDFSEIRKQIIDMIVDKNYYFEYNNRKHGYIE